MSIGKIRGWAYALLHLTPEQFADMMVGEFWEAMQAYQEEKEADRRHFGELVRGATLRLWNLQVGKGHQITDPGKFWPMPWDEGSTSDAGAELARMTKEERDAAAREFLERLGANG